MRKFSRHMPAYQAPKTAFVLPFWLVMGLTVLAVLYGPAMIVYHSPQFGVIIAACATWLWIFLKRANERDHARMVAIGLARKHLSICDFARSFDRRVVDPWVIRAVYEEVGHWLGGKIPVMAEDDFTKILQHGSR